MSAYDIMLPSMSEIDSKIEAAQQQKIDDFRKNAAYNALVHTYGPAAGDPQAYGQMQAADMAKQKLPGELQAQTLDNQKTQADIATSQQALQQKRLLTVGALLKGQGDPAILDSPVLQKFGGFGPDEAAAVKQFITGPDGKVDPGRVDSLTSAGLGTAGMLFKGAPIVSVGSDGQPQATFYNPRGDTNTVGLPGTPTALINAQSNAANRQSMEANRAVVPNGYDENAAQAAIKQGFPDAVVTSGARTAAQNAAAGGAPNSAHLSGQAMDLRVPPGVTGQQYADKLNAYLAYKGLPGRAIYESATDQYSNGPHVHYQWSAGAPQVNQTLVAAQSAKAHATAQAQADVAGQKAANTAVGKAQGAAAAQGILGKQDIARAQEQATNADIRFSSAIANLQQARKYSDQAGSIAFATQHVPGSSGANFASTLNSVHSDIVNNVINSYKESTPKGQASGVGRVMSSEIKLWQDAYASVNINQSPSLRAQNLQRLMDVTNRLRSASRAYFKQGFGVSAPGAAPAPSSGGWSIKQVQ